MQTIKPSLFVYGIAGIIYFISALLGWEVMSYVTKPLFIGAIIAYYLIESFGKLNLKHIAIICLMFVSGVINLFDYKEFFNYVLCVNFATYLLFFYILLKKIINLKWNAFEKDLLISVFLMLIFFTCLVYICVIIVFDETFAMYKFIYAYSFVLVLVAISSVVLNQLERDKKNTYLFFAIMTLIVCEFFYALYYYYNPFFFFRCVSIFCYVISFYFLVNYFLGEDKSNNNKINFK